MVKESDLARSSRGRRWLSAGLALVVLVLGGAAALPVLSGRTEAPRFSNDSAVKAVAEAREAGAMRWAPESLLAAEAALRVAMAEHRRQEVRFVLLRDFGAARAGFRLAHDKALAARDEAVLALDAAGRAAEQAIAEAGVAVDVAQSYANLMHLSAAKRILLQKSKIAFEEAKIFVREGEPIVAKEKADHATAQAQKVQEGAVSLAARYVDPERLRLWTRWAEETIRESARSGGNAIVVYKEQHRLVLYRGGRPARSYPADMGYNMLASRQRAGDGVTPEGRYRVSAKKGLGNSVYHKALLLDFPNEDDRRWFGDARRRGLIPRGASIGGLIEVHGEGGLGKDWTRGCVALSNPDMDDLFSRVEVGVAVTIVGSDGKQGLFTDLVRRSRSTPEGQAR